MRGELPAWLEIDRDRGTRSPRCSTGCMIQSIEEGAGYRRSDAERRVLGADRDVLIAASATPRPPEPLEAAPPRPLRRPARQPRRLVTDRPRSRPDRPRARSTRPTLGWALPHEHTAIALWHIPNRWDYWELRRDEPVIVEELAAFRAAGGGTIVDLTLDGRRARPGLARRARPRRPASTSSWAPAGIATPTTRPRRSIDRRSVDDARRRDRPRRDRGRRRRPASGPGSSARSGRTSRGSRPRRSGSTAPPPGPPGGPGSRSRPTPSSRRSGSTSSTSSRRRAPTCRGSSSATPTRTRRSTTTWRSSSAARRSSSTSSG